MIVLGVPKVVGPCYVYATITWLTHSIDHMKQSHLVTEEFYNNTKRCLMVKSNNRVESPVNPNDMFAFPFTNN